MTFKEHFKSVMSMYFIIVTLVNAATKSSAVFFAPTRHSDMKPFSHRLSMRRLPSSRCFVCIQKESLRSGSIY